MSWKTKHLNLSFLFYSIKFKIHLGLIHHSTPPARVESGLQGMERDWDKEGLTWVGEREGQPRAGWGEAPSGSPNTKPGGICFPHLLISAGAINHSK